MSSALESLVAMGFAENRSIKALAVTGNGSIDQALNWIMEHQDDADIDEPYDPKAGNTTGTVATPAATPAAGAGAGEGLPPADAAAAAAAAGGRSDGNTVDLTLETVIGEASPLLQSSGRILLKLTASSIQCVRGDNRWKDPTVSFAEYVDAYMSVCNKLTASTSGAKAASKSGNSVADDMYWSLVSFFESHCDQLKAKIDDVEAQSRAEQVQQGFARYNQICQLAALFYQYLDRYYVEREGAVPLLEKWQSVWERCFGVVGAVSAVGDAEGLRAICNSMEGNPTGSQPKHSLRVTLQGAPSTVVELTALTVGRCRTLARLAEDVAAGEAAGVAGGTAAAAAAAAGIVPLDYVIPAAMERIIAFDSALATALGGAANAGANAISVTWPHSVDEMCTLHTCIGAATFSPLSTPELLDVINAANFLEHFEVLDVALVEMAARFVGMKLVDVNAALAAADLEPLSGSGNSEHKLGSYAYDCASGPAATSGGGGGGGAAATAAASSGAGAVVGGVSNARVEQDHVQGQLCVAADGTPFVLEHHVIEKCKALNPASPFVQSTTMSKGVISMMLATLERRQKAAASGAATGVVAEQYTTTSTGTPAERKNEKSVSAASASVDSTVATPTVTPKSSDETKTMLTAAVRQLCEYEPALAAMLRDILLTMNSSCTLSGINSATLAKVIEYCTYHMDDPPQDDDSQKSEPITGWDTEFVQMDQASLFELIQAGNTLDCKPLLDLACKAVAEMIKGKTPEEIRKHFNIKNDFTAEEEEQVRRENEWCEERHA